MDHHTIAAVSIAGTCLDVIGSLYLAYDLLGGQHGPLRLLTRAVTYSVVFGVGYALGLGLLFGLAAGVATGITIAIELNRAARGLNHYSLWGEGFFSAIRAAAFGAVLYRSLGLGFAAAFALLLTIGQVFAYSRGMRPAMDYAATGKPRLTRRLVWGILMRTVGYTAGTARRPRVVICDSRGPGYGSSDRDRRSGHSDDRVLRRQATGAAHGGVWDCADLVRFCAAIISVLGGGVGCAGDVSVVRSSAAVTPGQSK